MAALNQLASDAEGVKVVRLRADLAPPTPQRRMTQKLLFVCLGNICRSPAAEGSVFASCLKSEA